MELGQCAAPVIVTRMGGDPEGDSVELSERPFGRELSAVERDPGGRRPKPLPPSRYGFPNATDRSSSALSFTNFPASLPLF